MAVEANLCTKHIRTVAALSTLALCVTQTPRTEQYLPLHACSAVRLYDFPFHV